MPMGEALSGELERLRESGSQGLGVNLNEKPCNQNSFLVKIVMHDNRNIKLRKKTICNYSNDNGSRVDSDDCSEMIKSWWQ